LSLEGNQKKPSEQGRKNPRQHPNKPEHRSKPGAARYFPHALHVFANYLTPTKIKLNFKPGNAKK
jgi:hypothetical protein